MWSRESSSNKRLHYTLLVPLIVLVLVRSTLSYMQIKSLFASNVNAHSASNYCPLRPDTTEVNFFCPIFSAFLEYFRVNWIEFLLLIIRLVQIVQDLYVHDTYQLHTHILDWWDVIFQGGKKVVKFANMENHGLVCLLPQNDSTILAMCTMYSLSLEKVLR